jgi:hypothetical protein
MFTTVTQKLTQRLLPFAVVGGMALLAYFAADFVEYFSSLGSSTPEFYPAPIIRAPW